MTVGADHWSRSCIPRCDRLQPFQPFSTLRSSKPKCDASFCTLDNDRSSVPGAGTYLTSPAKFHTAGRRSSPTSPNRESPFSTRPPACRSWTCPPRKHISYNSHRISIIRKCNSLPGRFQTLCLPPWDMGQLPRFPKSREFSSSGRRARRGSLPLSASNRPQVT
jgi:hypothetical protein